MSKAMDPDRVKAWVNGQKFASREIQRDSFDRLRRETAQESFAKYLSLWAFYRAVQEARGLTTQEEDDRSRQRTARLFARLPRAEAL